MTKKPAKKVAAKKPRVLSGAAWKKKHDELLNTHKQVVEMSLDMASRTLNIILDNAALCKKVAAYEQHISNVCLGEIVEHYENA